MYIARYDKEGSVYFGRAWNESGVVQVRVFLYSNIFNFFFLE